MFKKLFAKKENKPVPDSPIGFGYKNKWLAISSTDPQRVVASLRLKGVRTCNWAQGVDFAYEKGVFVTPPIGNWILVLGIDVEDLQTESTRELLTRLSTEFGECQLFQTHRVVEYHYWGLSQAGNIKRLYAYLGESGENLVVEGLPTEVESKLNLVNTFTEEAAADSYWEREDLDLPDEQMVMDIAEAWSINPTKIGEMTGIEGLGWIGR